MASKMSETAVRLWISEVITEMFSTHAGSGMPAEDFLGKVNQEILDQFQPIVQEVFNDIVVAMNAVSESRNGKH